MTTTFKPLAETPEGCRSMQAKALNGQVVLFITNGLHPFNDYQRRAFDKFVEEIGKDAQA